MSQIPDINKAVTAAINNLPSSGAGTSPESGGCSNCSMCKKSPGLVILPVRYSAIAESEAHGIHGLNPISDGDPFGEGVLDKPLKHARYILRCMRRGYFYLHFPSGDADGATWRKYRVTSDSNFISVPLDGQSAHGMEMSEACRSPSDWQMARCVTIRQPEKITEAWLAFSDTDWNSTLRDRIAKDPAARMQSLNPSACVSDGSGQPHTAPLSEVTDWVSEYRHNTLQSFRHTVADQDDAENTATFESVYPFHWRAFEAEHLLETAERTSPGRSIIFAAHDPRGITVELNAEQIQSVAASLQRRSWRMASWEGIQAIKAAVMRPHLQKRLGDDVINMLETDLEVAKEGLWIAQHDLAEGENPEGNRRIIDYYEQEIETLERQIHDRIKDEDVLQKRGEQAWKRTRNEHFGIIELDETEYLRLSDKDIREDIQENALDDLQNDQENIHIPLSEDHATWLQTNDLKSRFQCDYRKDDLDSGREYVLHFIECIEDAADRAECEEVIQQWVSQGNLDDTSNILLRSLVLNQDNHADAVNDLSGTAITTGNAYTILNGLKNTWVASRRYMLNPEVSENAAKNAFSRLIHQTGAPVAKFLSRQIDSAAMNLYLAATMLANEKLIIQRPLAGNPAQQLSWMAARARVQIPRNKRPSQQQMETIMKHWLAVGRDQSVLRIPDFVLIDDTTLRRVADGPGSGRAAQTRLLNSGHPIALTPDNIRENALPRFQAWANGDMRIAAVGLLFNTVSTLFARDAMEQADVFADEEATGRFAACSAGLIGSVFNLVESGIKRFEANGLIGEKPKTKVAVRWAGRVFGAGAAWGFAYYDFQNLKESFRSGNWGMAILYGASMVTNTFLGVMSMFVNFLAGWAALIFLIALGIALLIEVFRDSAAQNWLSHCFYGSEDCWPDIRTSDNELQKVLAV